MHAAGRRCLGLPAASYQIYRGATWETTHDPWREMSNGLLRHFQQERENTVVPQPIPSPNSVLECILRRSAAKCYDSAGTLGDDQIRELVRIGTTAPTSFQLAELALHRRSHA